MIEFLFAVGLAVSAQGAVSGAIAEATVCDVIGAPPRSRQTRIVSITAGARFDFEYGYFLQSLTDCPSDPSNTGLLFIEAPRGRSIRDYPELSKLSSQDWLRQNVGRYVVCTCVGRVSYQGEIERFELIEAVSCEGRNRDE